MLAAEGWPFAAAATVLVLPATKFVPGKRDCLLHLVAGVFGYAGAEGRPFAAASVKHGIVVGGVALAQTATAGHRHSEDGRSHAGSDAANKVSPATNLTDHELPCAVFFRV